MKLIQILLPTHDNDGLRIARQQFDATARELVEKFGGLTAHTRAPLEGTWKPLRVAQYDDLVIYEVMAQRLNRAWWRRYREKLEREYRQQKIVIRAHDFVEI